MQGFQARRIAFNLGLSGKAFKEMVKFIFSLYAAYEATDSSLFEINPQESRDFRFALSLGISDGG